MIKIAFEIQGKSKEELLAAVAVIKNKIESWQELPASGMAVISK